MIDSALAAGRRFSLRPSGLHFHSSSGARFYSGVHPSLGDIPANADARLSPAEEAQCVGVEVQGEGGGVAGVGEAVPINQARLQRRRDLQLPSNSRTFLCFMSPDTLTVTTVTRGSDYAGLGPV